MTQNFVVFFVGIITNIFKTAVLTILLNYLLKEWRWIWFILTNAHKMNWWEIQETSSDRNDSNQCPRRAVAVIWLGISRNQNTINVYTCYIDTQKLNEWHCVWKVSNDLQKRHIVLLVDNCPIDLAIKKMRAINLNFYDLTQHRRNNQWTKV